VKKSIIARPRVTDMSDVSGRWLASLASTRFFSGENHGWDHEISWDFIFGWWFGTCLMTFPLVI